MESGLRKPTESARTSRVAPAFAAASKTCSVSSMGVLAASMSVKFTFAPFFCACVMLSVIFLSACCLVSLRRYLRLSPLNGASMVMFFILHSRHASTLSLVACAEAVRVAFLKVSLTMRLTLCLSASDSDGMPTLITDMPVSSISLASLTCST